MLVEVAVQDEKLAHPLKKAQKPRMAGARITHPDRLLYEGSDITKQDLANYLTQVAPRMLNYVGGRPLTLLRCPQGQKGECFIQRHLEAPHVHTMRGLGDKDGFCYVDSDLGLVSLVQHGVMELHTWGSHKDRLERPDTLVFDLDPGPNVHAGALARAAQHVCTLLAAQKLRSFLKRTGGRGLHVVVPLQPRAGWEAVKTFAHSVAARLEAEDPLYTSSSSKAERVDHVFVDYHRNARSASAVALYSPRARAGAPVALPMAWEDLNAHALAEPTSLAQALAMLKRPDPWADYLMTKQELVSELATG